VQRIQPLLVAALKSHRVFFFTSRRKYFSFRRGNYKRRFAFPALVPRASSAGGRWRTINRADQAEPLSLQCRNSQAPGGK
jgi:hypothetical protein